jgi:hypothetical protein
VVQELARREGQVGERDEGLGGRAGEQFERGLDEGEERFDVLWGGKSGAWAGEGGG